MVKVELLVGRAVSESLDVHQVAVHVRVVQSAERHVYRGEGEGSSSCQIPIGQSHSLLFLTCRLLFLDGRGQRGAALHACRHDNLRGRHSNHGGGGRGWRGRHGNSGFLYGLLRGLGGNRDSAVLVQLPLHCALYLSPEEQGQHEDVSTGEGQGHVHS